MTKIKKTVLSVICSILISSSGAQAHGALSVGDWTVYFKQLKNSSQEQVTVARKNLNYYITLVEKFENISHMQTTDRQKKLTFILNQAHDSVKRQQDSLPKFIVNQITEQLFEIRLAVLSNDQAQMDRLTQYSKRVLWSAQVVMGN